MASHEERLFDLEVQVRQALEIARHHASEHIDEGNDPLEQINVVGHTHLHGISAHTEHANHKALYTDGSGDEQELSLGADGTFFQSGGASTAPEFTALVDGDIPATHSGSAHHTEDHDHDGAPTQKLIAANTHESVSTDTHHAESHTLGSHVARTHSSLTSIGTDQHHAQSHTLASHSAKAHADLSDAPASAHHAKYTDSDAIGAVEGEATLDLLGDVTIAGTKSLKVDVIGEKDAAAGVTIDSVLLKDGVVTVGDVAFDDATSDPLIDADTAADGTENSVAHKDHVHPKHHAQAHAAAQHNAAALPASANEDLGAFYLDVDQIASPTNPASGTRRIFMNSSTGLLSVRIAAGVDISLESPTANQTVAGIIEVATTAETTTGTDSGRAVSPDGLAGSEYGERAVQLVVFDFATDVATGDGKYFFHIDSRLAGMDLVDAHATVITAGTTGNTTIQIRNATDTADMLSTVLTIASGSKESDGNEVVDTTKDDVVADDQIAVDVDSVSTTEPLGLIITLGFRLP